MGDAETVESLYSKKFVDLNVNGVVDKDTFDNNINDISEKMSNAIIIKNFINNSKKFEGISSEEPDEILQRRMPVSSVTSSLIAENIDTVGGAIDGNGIDFLADELGISHRNELVLLKDKLASNVRTGIFGGKKENSKEYNDIINKIEGVVSRLNEDGTVKVNKNEKVEDAKENVRLAYIQLKQVSDYYKENRNPNTEQGKIRMILVEAVSEIADKYLNRKNCEVKLSSAFQETYVKPSRYVVTRATEDVLIQATLNNRQLFSELKESGKAGLAKAIVNHMVISNIRQGKEFVGELTEEYYNKEINKLLNDEAFNKTYADNANRLGEINEDTIGKIHKELVQNMREIQSSKEGTVVEGTENVNKIEVNEVNKGSEEIGVNMN